MKLKFSWVKFVKSRPSEFSLVTCGSFSHVTVFSVKRCMTKKVSKKWSVTANTQPFLTVSLAKWKCPQNCPWAGKGKRGNSEWSGSFNLKISFALFSSGHTFLLGTRSGHATDIQSLAGISCSSHSNFYFSNVFFYNKVTAHNFDGWNWK